MIDPSEPDIVMQTVQNWIFHLPLTFFLGQLALNLLAIIHEIGLIFQEYVVMDY